MSPTAEFAQAVYKEKKNMVYSQRGVTGTVINNNNVFSVFVLVCAFFFLVSKLIADWTH